MTGSAAITEASPTVEAADRVQALRRLEAARRAKAARRRWLIVFARIALIVAFLAAWELSSGTWLDEFFVSRPSAIAVTFWEWIVDGTLLQAAGSTVSSAVIGFVIGGIVAIIVGYVLGTSNTLAAIFEPFITAIYSLPKVALIPLFVLWFGIGRDLQVLICALIVFFLMFYNTYFGIRDVDRHLVDAVRVMGASPRVVALSVRLPSALVWVVAGLKLSIPQALLGVVVAEILAGSSGLGHLLALNAGYFNAAGTFAALFALLVLGVSAERLASLLTRRALRWKQSEGAPGDDR